MARACGCLPARLWAPLRQVRRLRAFSAAAPQKPPPAATCCAKGPAGAAAGSAAAAAAAACLLAGGLARADAEETEEERWERAALAVLPPPPTAQLTRVARRPGLISDAEIDALLVAVEQMQPTAGRFARDAQGVPQLGSAPWETTYLHTDGGFERLCAPLRQKLLDAAIAVDAEEGWGLLTPREASCGPIRFRTVEYHEVQAHGALPDPTHFDGGSLVTIDVMLANPCASAEDGDGRGGREEGDFEGGRFVTVEADGSLTAHRFERGDAIFFVSHKYHSVQPVTRGRRAVLVAELWHGPERRCAHRCEQRTGECGYSTSEANAERLLKGETPDLY